MVKLEGERADRRRSHWESVAAGACEQCGRAFLPEIAAPCTLETALGQTPADWTRLTPDPAAEQPMAALDPPGIGLAVLIGPEGGLDDGERSLAEAAGFQPVRLGPRVLRTETPRACGEIFGAEPGGRPSASDRTPRSAGVRCPRDRVPGDTR